VSHDLFLSKRKHLKVLLGTDKGYQQWPAQHGNRFLMPDSRQIGMHIVHHPCDKHYYSYFIGN